MGVLVWSEYAGAERARVGGLEFFVVEGLERAWFYPDQSSFDSGIGGERFPSVAAAKERAEQIARETHAALSEALAPMLQWSTEENHFTAKVGVWWLWASPDEWTVTAEGSDGPTSYGGSFKSTDAAAMKRAAENALRALGVAFRVEREEPQP